MKLVLVANSRKRPKNSHWIHTLPSHTSTWEPHTFTRAQVNLSKLIIVSIKHRSLHRPTIVKQQQGKVKRRTTCQTAAFDASGCIIKVENLQQKLFASFSLVVSSLNEHFMLQKAFLHTKLKFLIVFSPKTSIGSLFFAHCGSGAMWPPKIQSGPHCDKKKVEEIKVGINHVFVICKIMWRESRRIID